MSRYISRSAEVLSNADRAETQLNWILFAQEQDARIWAPRIELTDENGVFNTPCYYENNPKSDEENPLCVEHGEYSYYSLDYGPNRPCYEYLRTAWYPGDELYSDPRRSWWPEGVQYVRPMISELSITFFHNNDRVDFIPRCKDCLVSWVGDDPCWVCGVECGPTSSLHTRVMYHASETRRNGPMAHFVLTDEGRIISGEAAEPRLPENLWQQIGWSMYSPPAEEPEVVILDDAMRNARRSRVSEERYEEIRRFYSQGVVSHAAPRRPDQIPITEQRRRR